MWTTAFLLLFALFFGLMCYFIYTLSRSFTVELRCTNCRAWNWYILPNGTDVKLARLKCKACKIGNNALAINRISNPIYNRHLERSGF